ncbi:hypothetical protein L1887_02432 [Cichorium endivia]|nr:hypothetical protein L1887_02432 [Cichorium endivia]
MSVPPPVNHTSISMIFGNLHLRDLHRTATLIVVFDLLPSAICHHRRTIATPRSVRHFVLFLTVASSTRPHTLAFFFHCFLLQFFFVNHHRIIQFSSIKIISSYHDKPISPIFFLYIPR